MDTVCFACRSDLSVLGEVRLRWPLNPRGGFKAEKTRSNNGSGGGL